MNERQLRQTLDLAFKDRAPKEYAQMKRQGELATYLDSLTFGAMQSISTATNKTSEALMNVDDPMERVQKAEMIRKTAEEVALSQALEALPLELIEDETSSEPLSLYELTGDESLLTPNRVR